MSTLRNSLTWSRFCFVKENEWHAHLRDLAQMSHGLELWKHRTSLLEEYIVCTFEACHRQQKLQYFESLNGSSVTVFNTSLVTHAWEEIYGVFVHWSTTAPEWKMHGFLTESAVREWGFVGKLERPVYFDDPSALVLDLRGKINPNFENLLAQNQAAACLQGVLGANVTESVKLATLQDAFNRAKYMCHVNYRTPVPQFGFDFDPKTNRVEGRLGFLLPLYITHQPCPDLVLLVVRSPEASSIPDYIGAELYPAEVAYRNARLLGKVESEWLRTAIAWIQNQMRMTRTNQNAMLETAYLRPPASQDVQHSLALVNPEPVVPLGNPQKDGLLVHNVYGNVAGYKMIHNTHCAPMPLGVIDGYKTGDLEIPVLEADRACYAASNCFVESDATFSIEMNQKCVERPDSIGSGNPYWRELTPTPPIPSPTGSPTPHCEEKPGVTCSCPRMDHYYSIVRLTDLQRSYIRYIVVSSPYNPSELYTIGIRYVCETKGAQQLLKILEGNMAAEYKKGAQRRLCSTVIEGQFCHLGCNCADIHVTPEGWKTKRPWIKDRNRPSSQNLATVARQPCAV